MAHTQKAVKDEEVVDDRVSNRNGAKLKFFLDIISVVLRVVEGQTDSKAVPRDLKEVV